MICFALFIVVGVGAVSRLKKETEITMWMRMMTCIRSIRHRRGGFFLEVRLSELLEAVELRSTAVGIAYAMPSQVKPYCCALAAFWLTEPAELNTLVVSVGGGGLAGFDFFKRGEWRPT
jgi:hypothetical protein